MKLLIGLVIVLLLFLGLAPLWGGMAALIYGAIDWVGTLFTDAALEDGRIAFRAGVTVGGLIAVSAMLRVALQDRSRAYLIAAAALSAGFLLLLIATGLSPSPSPRSGHWSDAGWSAPGPARDAVGRPDGVRRWKSREAYEHDGIEHVRKIARAAARGRSEQAYAWLGELKHWARRRPTEPDDRALYRQVWAEYEQTFEPGADSSPRVTVEAMMKRQRALRQLWELAPNAQVGLRVLLADESGLYIAGIRQERRAANGQANPELERSLRDIHVLQETLLTYVPCMPELWKNYAAAMVDTDEELALGAMRIGQWCAGEGRDSSSYEELSSQRILLASDFRIRTSLLERMTGERATILEARARPEAQAPDASSKAAADVDGSSVEAPTSAARVMPPAGRLLEGKGLALQPVPVPPSAPPLQGRGTARVDMAGAGLEPVELAIDVSGPGVYTSMQAVLALDVWEDGRVTAVLVERSSGDDALDQAARDAARNWKAAGKVQVGGELRRVTVAFDPPAPGP
ncbi:MAG: energy transducer TonB family protein [Stenotrophomonas sp.]